MPWKLTTFGLLLGMVLAGIAFAPARWVASGIAQATHSRVLLVEPLGTVWSGSARLVLGAGEDSMAHTALPGRVQWDLRPNLQGLKLELQASCCLAQPWVWTLTPSVSGMAISASDQLSTWPSELLAGLGTPWNTLQLKGALALSTQQLLLTWRNSGWHMKGLLQFDLTQASTSLSTLNPIGSYRLVIAGGDVPTINLSTLEGSLQLSGSGRLDKGRLFFDGEASATPTRVAALDNLLNILGRRDGARVIIKVG